MVDDADYEEFKKHKWCTNRSGNIHYAMRHIKKEDGKQTLLYMHQAVIGKNSNLHIDHIDGNGLNNQRNNLRHVTPRQNSQNLHIPKSSQYTGVYWHKRDEKWMSQIRINGKVKYLGYFENEYAAHLAYLNASKNLLNKEVI